MVLNFADTRVHKAYVAKSLEAIRGPREGRTEWLIRLFQARVSRDKSGSCSRLKLRELCRCYRGPGHRAKRRETRRGFSPSKTRSFNPQLSRSRGSRPGEQIASVNGNSATSAADPSSE